MPLIDCKLSWACRFGNLVMGATSLQTASQANEKTAYESGPGGSHSNYLKPVTYNLNTDDGFAAIADLAQTGKQPFDWQQQAPI